MRLDKPIKKLTQFKGAVAIGIFEDGTILVAGPMDDPILIRHGAVMRLVPGSPDAETAGDLVFKYAAST